MTAALHEIAPTPRRPVESEKAEKAEKFWSKRGPAGPWDVIVIGSGMGGLTAAAMLSELGQRVLVLEQHYVPGGFTHVFKRPGYSWDVGVHAVGEVTRHSLPGRVLDRLTGGALEWASLGPVYDEFHFPGDFRIDFPDDPRQYRQNLIDAFPNETEAIDGYLRLVRDVSGAMRRYYLARLTPASWSPLLDRTVARKAQRYLEMKTADVVAGLTDDPRLRALFTAQWGYYGSVPSRSSFAIQALVVKHFLHGGYYPVGGSQQIAKTLLERVARTGGWTRISTPVERILIEGGRAVGVVLEGGDVIRAPRVVSAAGVSSTVRRLLPPEVAQTAWSRQVADLRPGPAHVCLYLGFKGDIRRAGATAANRWFYHTWDMEVPGWDVDPARPVGEAPVLYTSFPSLKDPEHEPGPEQRHTGEVVTFVPWEVFERWQGSRWKKRGPDYDAFKAALSEQMLRQILAHMPELEPMIDHVELSTPLSTDHFTRAVSGSIYGLEPTPERFRCKWLRPRSPIPGLFFAGSEIASVGVVGAMMGGVLAATAAEPRKALSWLRSS